MTEYKRTKKQTERLFAEMGNLLCGLERKMDGLFAHMIDAPKGDLTRRLFIECKKDEYPELCRLLKHIEEAHDTETSEEKE